MEWPPAAGQRPAAEAFGKEAFVKHLVACAAAAAIGMALTAGAEEEKPLGNVQVGLKGNFVKYTDDVLKDMELEEGGYGGLMLYVGVADGFYLGVEGGAAYSEKEEGDFKWSLTYAPIEANAKLVVKPADWLVLSVGGGGLYGYTKFEVEVGDDKDDTDDWVFGGQAFAEADLLFGPFFIGANGKYQMTQEFKDADFELNNWQVGGQLGFKF